MRHENRRRASILVFARFWLPRKCQASLNNSQPSDVFQSFPCIPCHQSCSRYDSCLFQMLRNIVRASVSQSRTLLRPPPNKPYKGIYRTDGEAVREGDLLVCQGGFNYVPGLNVSCFYSLLVLTFVDMSGLPHARSRTESSEGRL